MSVHFTVKEIVTAVGGTVLGTDNAEVCGVSTDSRTVTRAELFIPLRGDRFDGHDFIAGALDRGVTVFMAERSWDGSSNLSADVTCIIVDDTLRALGDLAAFHRKRFTVPIVAVTGSNGKTTTKEMLAAILDQTGRGLKTAGNLNNLIGLPLMLFQLGEEHRWAVLEMGMSEPGEIARLTEIARPNLGIVTNVAPAHLQSMGTVEAVAKAKGELLQRLEPGCSAVINGDDDLVAGLPIPDGVRRITFGFGAVTVRAEDRETLGRAGQSFVIAFPDQRITVSLKVFGRHNIANALAAATAAQVLGVAPEVISRGLASFVPVAKRFAPEDVGGIQLVDDSYNANPASVRAALETLAGFKEEGRGIAVLGDMLELGEGSRKAHEEIGRLAATCVERLYAFGAMASAVADGAAAAGLANDAIIVADDHGQILDDILAFMVPGDCVLVKGSRGMRMETVAEGIRAAKGGAN